MRRDVETYLASAGPAALPERYEAAKTALANCTKIDECKDWADKAAALASYAHQSKARELENNCRRIRARATRHLGELLREIEPSKGGRPKETPDGGDPSLDESESPPHTRTKAATEAGPSERQRKTALRVANIEFTLVAQWVVFGGLHQRHQPRTGSRGSYRPSGTARPAPRPRAAARHSETGIRGSR
jgi:hypothetical protein